MPDETAAPADGGAGANFLERHARRIPLFLCVLCALFLARDWLRMDSFWGDAPRWQAECWRASGGEVPYRDFTFQYPPLALWLFAGAYRLLGATYLTTQLMLAGLGVGCVLLTYGLARRVLPLGLAFAASVLLLIGFGTEQSDQRPWSLSLYSPAVPVNMAGYLTFLIGLLDYVRDGQATRARLALIGVSAAVVFLSKPEGALVVVLSLLSVAIADLGYRFAQKTAPQWGRFYLGLAALCLVPATLIYAGFAVLTGPRPLLEGITGYGQATIACPLWPTIVGLAIGFSETCLGLAVAAIYALVTAAYLRRRGGENNVTRTVALLSLIPVGVGFWILVDVLRARAAGRAASVSLGSLVPLFNQYQTYTAPTRWACVLIVLYFAGAYLARRIGKRPSPSFDRQTFVLFLLCLGAFAMHSRSLFASHINRVPQISFISSPLLSIVAVSLLVAFARWALTFRAGGIVTPALAERAAQTVCAPALALACGLIGTTRLLAPDVRRDTLQTRAGTVHLNAAYPSRLIYDYIEQNTRPDDRIFDLTYGGIHFATRRPPASVITQYAFLKPSPMLIARDGEYLRAHPPALVIGYDPIDGVVQYGVNRPVACPCPRLVFLPTGNGSVPGVQFPAIEYARANYIPRIGFPPHVDPGDNLVGQIFGSKRVVYRRR